MKALLRFQAVVLARTLSNPFLLLLLALPLACVAFGVGARGFARGTFAVAALAIVLVLAVVGMIQTFAALDGVRWSGPVAHGRAFAAHVLFWLAAAAGPVALVCSMRGAESAAFYLFADAMVLVAATATAVPAFQHLRRRSTPLRIVLLVVFCWILVGPTVMSLAFAWSGEGPLCLVPSGIVFVVLATMGTVAHLRDELAPAASGRAARDRTTPRSPTASLLRATYPVGWTALWVVIGGFYTLAMPSTGAFWAAVAGTSLVGFGLAAWRRLMASPIDRGRAFRVLFGPAVAFVVLTSVASLVVVEATSDRSAFFRDYRVDGFFTRGPATLRLYDVLKSDDGDRTYRAPEVPAIAARVRSHILREYGLRVPQERIEAAMLRGWPTTPPTGIMDADQRPTLDAIERVRVDLADDLRAAGRRRDATLVAVTILAFLILFRIQFLGGFRATAAAACMAALLVMTIAPPRLVPDWLGLRERLFVPFQEAPWPVPVIVLLGVAGAGVLLWRSSARAFRRLELTDIRQTNTMVFGGASAS